MARSRMARCGSARTASANFSGPARWRAKHYCLQQAANDCVCDSCASLADHPDFILLEAGSLKIENVRDVIGRASLKPLVSPHRVVLIRDAHLLTIGAQNALLKTLEEPTGQTLFFLVTHRERTLLPTIRSRCQKLRFSPFDAAAFATHFPELVSAAGASGGSVAEAKRLAASEVKPLNVLLRATVSERIAAAEGLSEDQETTLAAARRYADQLTQWTRSGSPEQRARAQELFGGLNELLWRSEGNVNRRLLWERWLLSPAPEIGRQKRVPLPVGRSTAALAKTGVRSGCDEQSQPTTNDGFSHRRGERRRAACLLREISQRRACISVRGGGARVAQGRARARRLRANPASGHRAARARSTSPNAAPMRVIRALTPEDAERVAALRVKERDAFKFALEKLRLRRLPAKMVAAELSFTEDRLVFYFASEERLDFRHIIRDLSAEYRARVEIRQIGARDAAKIIGGIGSCGRALCCSTWLVEFRPVSIKMAKDQNLALNPQK